SADGCAPSCASRKSAPASDDARPTITAGPMPFSRLTAYSPFARPMSKRDTPDEETNDWRAVCGRTARTVRRAGRAQPFPTPIGYREKRARFPDTSQAGIHIGHGRRPEPVLGPAKGRTRGPVWRED